ncbi:MULTISPECIES: anthranilate phosphoribosyltransferase [Archaeoglobus]|jgi:anthranilate phosphoribosyltransferase|nr:MULTISPECIES: anthranilate phosphoribosyltransferase [Archaeoglobus]KUJ93835.1 MAG: Tryptophan biosynthesis protein TrpCD [Archaeoglobus fulgidus]KUK07290.1 MAG: Tryptophan biosynthesis protein TrpCD [Archaeoglobus fulgidus]MDI3497136.1 anthranilate synthase/phosphoribosyltransferase [Archaeoglobus sp.]
MIEDVLRGLDFDKAYELAKTLPELDEIKIAAVLAALEAKGYGAEVIAGFAKGVAEKSKIEIGKVMDTCGTGGDKTSSINVSTAVAIALSTVHPVAKHGNRAVSSKSGSADVLEALGVRIEMDEERARKMIAETNFAFLFAPLYHKSFARVAAVRRNLGIRTIFNVTGPLTNPARPEVQIVGVASEILLVEVAKAMSLLGRRAVVVYGSGMDEVNPNSSTDIAVVNGGVERLKLEPEDFGIERCRVLPCSSSGESAERIRAVFSGKGLKEDRRLIAINFATALFALGYEDLKENVEIFEEKVQSGELARKLEEIACKSTSM